MMADQQTWEMPEQPESYPPCPCGREIKKLNAASDTPKCVGCGYPAEVCRCLVGPK